MANTTIRGIVCLFTVLVINSVVEASVVAFHLSMGVQHGYGLFDPASDTVVVRGDFNNWSGNQHYLSDDNEDLIYDRAVTLSVGGHSYKYVMIRASGDEVWESSIPDRWIDVGEEDILLDTVYFDNDATQPIPPRDIEVHFMVDMQYMVRKAAFEPDHDSVVVRGSHSALGNWGGTGAALSRQGFTFVYSAWVPFEDLSNYLVQYKYVLLRNGDSNDALWETSIGNRSFRISGDELDIRPSPNGNGYAEYQTSLVCFGHGSGWVPPELIVGADLSYVPQMESVDAEYRVAGAPEDVLDIFQQNGYRIVRLRLWHTPDQPWHGLDSTLAFAERVHATGFQFMLDIHFSDSWADPGQQAKPAAWASLDFATLVDSVYAYTNSVIRRFRDADVLPSYVQVGNEITAGCLWDDGRVGWEGSEWDTPQQWSHLAELLSTAIAALRDSLPVEDQPKVILHVDCGGDNNRCRWFFDHVTSCYVDFDLIGLSYYPWWHGSLSNLETNLRDLGERYGKGLLVVETSYPWTLEAYDELPNFVWQAEQLLPGYPATPAGQTDFLRSLFTVVQEVPNGLGKGLLYWEPAYLAVGGYLSPNENQTLFDFDGDALPALGFMNAAPLASPHVTIHSVGTEITLRWNAVPGAQGYRVEKATSPDGDWISADVVSTLSWSEAAVQGKTFYRVVAISTDWGRRR
jgi:arabinogalactan endo-1,4-beta-galactosidase